MQNEQNRQEKETKTEPVKRLKMPVVEEEPPKPELKAEACQHHFGYVGERQAKEKIPDECMTCENIVKCMLKKVAS